VGNTGRKELLIYQKQIDLIGYAYNLLRKYPKHEKYAMVVQIKNSLFDALRHIIRANKIYRDTPARLSMLNMLDAELQIQKVLVRMSHENCFISNKNYMEWSRRLDEIGRILGGWIKSTVK